MKLKVALGLFGALFLTSSFAWAGGKVPSFVEKWNVKSTGGMMLNAEKK